MKLNSNLKTYQSWAALSLAAFLIFGIGFSGCGASKSHRQSAQKENDANLKAAMEDLLPAEGNYTGKMILTKSASGTTDRKPKSYRVTLALRRIVRNQAQPTSTDPTQVIGIPKLSGNLEFDVLKDVGPNAWTNYPDILRPLGGFGHMVLDNGDFDPATLDMVLPYAVPGYSNGNYGQIAGSLSNGVFKGVWFAKPLGVVGRFTLRKVVEQGQPQ